jgi:hypothetical protein
MGSFAVVDEPEPIVSACCGSGLDAVLRNAGQSTTTNVATTATATANPDQIKQAFKRALAPLDRRILNNPTFALLRRRLPAGSKQRTRPRASRTDNANTPFFSSQGRMVWNASRKCDVPSWEEK